LAQIGHVQHLTQIQLAKSDTHWDLHVGRACLFLLTSLAAEAKVLKDTKWVMGWGVLPIIRGGTMNIITYDVRETKHN